MKEKKNRSSLLDRVAGVKQEANRLRLKKPYGIAVDSSGRIFVADPANRAVFVFDQQNHTTELRGNRAPASFALPMGLAIDEQDRLFVSDSHFGQITCFDPEGAVLAVFGHDTLQRPAGMAVDRARHRLYVADAKAHRVAVFDSATFQPAGFVGGPATPGEAEEGKFAAPTNVAVDHEGLLYVTDTWNHRIQIFNLRGKFLRTFGRQGDAPGMFARPKGVAIDSEGHVYVADAEFNNIQVLTPEGQPLLAIGGIGYGPGQFTLITGLAFDHNDRLYAAEQWQGRVQIFQYLPENPSTAKAAQ
jgi:DNA-binding beta-propeller fold protein YncE